jgi:hypothetical protein
VLFIFITQRAHLSRVVAPPQLAPLSTHLQYRCRSAAMNPPSSLNPFFLVLLSLLLSGISLNLIFFWETLNSSHSRLGLFATCRRFIDRSLYDELKQISQISSSGVSVELDTLPHPHAKPTSTSERRTSHDPSHSVLSKIIFSFCFSESCTLFLLLMCNASDTLNTR